MVLAVLVDTSRRIAETSKRREKTALLASLLRDADPEDIEPVVAFLSGVTRHGRIGIGWATLREVRVTPAATDPTLTVHDVERMLDEVAEVSGTGTGARKREIVGRLYARATAAEQEFLTVLLGGELRQGAMEGMMLDGLAEAFHADLAQVRRAAMLTGDLPFVARALRLHGPSGLSGHGIRMFRPIQPMLAETAEDAPSALSDLGGQAAVEYKFDGARVQVHRSGAEVRIFSRLLNDVTAAAPEVVDAVLALPEQNLILDGEVLAFHPSGRPQPFQVTMRRFGRRQNVDELRAALPLTAVWFDVLHAGGTDLIDQPQQRRFQALRSLVPESQLVPSLVATDPEQADAFLRGALDQGHEGIMAKALSAPYVAGARGQSWLKVKHAHTLDLAILAAEWGSGRRRGWLSNLHLGARDPLTNKFQMLGKTFKGLTDEMLAWQAQELLKHEIAHDRHTVYVEPALVVEIAFNDIQISPTYTSGLALRFARVKRFRPDRSVADSDTFQTVQQLAARMDGE